MPQPLAPESRVLAAPQFYVTPRQRFSPSSILLAVVIALACLGAVLYALSRTHYSGATWSEGDDDDPSRLDTIYVGGPDEAPTATRPKGSPSTVHPYVVVHLPRSGNGLGQIPDSAAGRLLYAWLAAFNGTDPSAFGRALPTAEAGSVEAAQVELRTETGGFTLLSAAEVQPGVLVFRLHDQTPSATEALGTLQVRPNSNPASIASFSLRAVSPPQDSDKRAVRP